MNSKFILGIIVSLLVGIIGGFSYGKSSAVALHAMQMQEMTDMMKSDGAQMEKMGAMMVEAGALMQTKGATYKDDTLVMMGKDLDVNGKKHEHDGKSMMSKDMMDMMSDGTMDEMPGMDMQMPQMNHDNM